MITYGRVSAVRCFGKISFLDLDTQTSKEEYVTTDELTITPIIKKLKLGTLVAITSKACNERGKKIIEKLEIEQVPSINFLKHDLMHDLEVRFKNRTLDLTTNRKERQALVNRSIILRTLRKVLEDYYEIETPVLQLNYGGAFSKPFVTSANYNSKKYYLRICHEFMLKKALIAGINKMYSLGPVFRNEDLDRTHTPEFSLLEVYERNGSYKSMIELTEKIVRSCGMAIGVTSIGSQNLDKPWPVIEYPEVVKKLNLELLNLKEQQLLVEKYLYENYGKSCVHLTRIPALLMPLAKAEKEFAEYADSYIRGIEIATMYSEQNQPDTLLQKWNEARKANLVDRSLVNVQFINDLKIGAPSAGGLGIGFDRLVQVLLDKKTIRQSQWFPFF